MREVRQTRLKMQRLRDNLFQTDSDRCSSDWEILWDFIHTDPFTRDIVNDLEDYSFDFPDWLEKAGLAHGYSFPSNERDRAAMCLAILCPANFASTDDTWNISVDLMLEKTGSHNTTRLIQAFFEAFLTPLYQYIDERLLERESVVTPSDIMLEITQVVGERMVSQFPKTAQALQAAYRDLYAASGTVIWQNIGNACRAALIAFADEIYVPDMAPAGTTQPKGDDAKQKIISALRHYYADGGRSKGRFHDALENLIEGTWDLASSLVHRKNATETDAKACVMYTYLAVWKVATVSSE